MIHPSTLDFLRKLKKNNNRDWFEKNKLHYAAAKDDVENNVGQILNEIRAFDKRISPDLIAKKCMFRIYRDVRFSKDKRPYKNNLGASMNPGGKVELAPGYYMHIEAGGAFLAGGIWQPPAPELAKIRQEIDYNFDEFKKIIADKSFRKYFGEFDQDDKLKTAPKGYPKDHPALDYLKLKSFVVVSQLTDKEVLSRNFTKNVATIFKAMLPLNNFLQRALD
ncbi:MAG TPA: DUF2461 domain-containing protein [Bacteroidia bacterium]|nr:DUF2461 domain-containing protein [Bacteroidia bacterium]